MADVRAEPLTVQEKLCYAVGEFSGVMMYNVISLYANIFLLEVVKFTPIEATAIIFGSRVWDVLAYPLLIPVLNATKPNKWGKYKIWMLASVLIMIPSNILVWYVPDIGYGARFAWYLVFYSVFLIIQTAYRMSHHILLMYMTEEPKDRDSATAYRLVCHVSSILLAIAVHGQIVGVFGTTDSASCINSTVTNTSTGTTADPETGYLVSAGTMSAITLVAVSTTLFGVKEYAGSTVPGDDTSKGTLLKDIWEVCTFRPFADLVGCGMISTFGIVLQEWSAALAIQYGLRFEDQLENLMLVFLASTVVFIPISAFLVTRFGKKLVYTGFNLVGVAASVSLMYIPARHYALFIALTLLGTGVSAPVFIPWTMLTDVADDFKIQKGKRRDMLLQTLYHSLDTTAMLLASVTSLVALEIGGYQTGACTQPDSVAFTTRLLISYLPAGFALLSMVFLWRYQLTGERLQANKAMLEERRTSRFQLAAADGGDTGGAAPQPALAMKSRDLPVKRGPVQLTYVGPYGSFRIKRH